jgi:hypothetical protein
VNRLPPPRRKQPSSPGGYRGVLEEQQPQVESEPPKSDDVSFAAGPAKYRGSAWVFLVVMAFLTPLAAIGLVLYMLPRVTGIEEMRLLRKELAETREQNAALKRSLDNVIARMNRGDDETRNRFVALEERLNRLEAK